jgi:hypothetical protein
MAACHRPIERASGSLPDVPPLDNPPPVQRAIRFVVQVCVTFSLAIGAADVASQHAPPHERAIWFGVAGGTTALCAWLGWGWLLKRARRTS